MANPTDQNPGCLTALFRLFQNKQDSQSSATQGIPTDDKLFPYRVRDDFLSPAEMTFYRLLVDITNQRALVCPKVNLADIFFVVNSQDNPGYRSRIAQKHLDFLLYDPKTLKPLVGIELDDSSHARSDRKTRDEFVEGVFQAAKLPLLRIPVQLNYNTRELATQLNPYLADNVSKPGAAPQAAVIMPEGKQEAPLCPKCGVPMVLRVASQGEKQGRRFYGCSNYPRCREILPVAKST